MNGRGILLLLVSCLGGPGASAERVFKAVGPLNADLPTVQAAIDAVPSTNPERKVILLQPGAYFGHTVLNKPNITLRGSGPDTLLTYNLGQAIPGTDGQPIGWQDTVRLETGRQYFEQCFISGHVDFIYGGATAWFQNCEIHCRDQGYVVAPATPAGKTGFVFAHCRITFPYGNPPVYLGRPWRESPGATFVRCELGAGIRPEGWKEWNVKPPLVRFAEYQCTGPGAAPAGRVAWATASAEPAPAEFTRERVLGDWQP